MKDFFDDMILENIINTPKQGDKERFVLKIGAYAVYTIVAGALIALVIALNTDTELSRNYDEYEGALGIGGLVTFFAVIAILGNIYDKINTIFKRDYIDNLVNAIFGESKYVPAEKINMEDFYKSDLFERKDKTTYSGNDYVKLKYKDKEIEYSELNVSYKTGAGKNKSHHTQFKGMMFKIVGEKEVKSNIKFKISEKFNPKKLSFWTKNGMFSFVSAGVVTSIYSNSNFEVAMFGGAFALSFIIISIIAYFIKSGNTGEAELEIVKNILGEELTEEADKFCKEEITSLKVSANGNAVYIFVDASKDLFEAKLFGNEKKRLKRDYGKLKKVYDFVYRISDKIFASE